MANKQPITYELYFNVTTWITLTDSDFYYLFKVCKNHYSHDCNSLALPGGVLYGNKNERDYRKKHGSASDWDSRKVEFTSRKLDILIKSLEMESTDQAGRLFYHLRLILRNMIDQVNEINEKHNGVACLSNS